MRTLLVTFAIGCAFASAAQAQNRQVSLVSPPAISQSQDDVMTSRFGNTTVARTAKGHEVHFYYNPDHTFTGRVVDVSYDLRGTWVVENGQLCRNYNPLPPMTTNPDCQTVAAEKIGDTWTVDGNTATLVAGIR